MLDNDVKSIEEESQAFVQHAEKYSNQVIFDSNTSKGLRASMKAELLEMLLKYVIRMLMQLFAELKNPVFDVSERTHYISLTLYYHLFIVTK